MKFPDRQRWDRERDSMWFPAETETGAIDCFVSSEVLDHCYDAGKQGRDVSFLRNREEIYALVEMKIRRRSFEKQGHILITSDDVDEYRKR